jgi:hypothetical protein
MLLLAFGAAVNVLTWNAHLHSLHLCKNIGSGVRNWNAPMLKRVPTACMRVASHLASVFSFLS